MSYNPHRFGINTYGLRTRPSKLEYRNDDGKLHRTDGPAIIILDGSMSSWIKYGKFRWYIDGRHLSFKKWCEMTEMSVADITLMMMTI